MVIDERDKYSDSVGTITYFITAVGGRIPRGSQKCCFVIQKILSTVKIDEKHSIIILYPNREI